MIEDGYREVKDPGKTRIPGGRFEIKKRTWGEHFERYRKKFGHKFSIEITNVPGFTNILLHIGNFIRDTSGCPLPNYGIVYNQEKKIFSGSQSTAAYLDFYRIIAEAFDQGKRVFITFDRNPPYSLTK
jgi:hypothetical protein